MPAHWRLSDLIEVVTPRPDRDHNHASHALPPILLGVISAMWYSQLDCVQLIALGMLPRWLWVVEVDPSSWVARAKSDSSCGLWFRGL